MRLCRYDNNRIGLVRNGHLHDVTATVDTLLPPLRHPMPLGDHLIANLDALRAQQGGFAERKTMIDREHDLPLTKQAKTLNISRRSLYYVPELVRPADLALMRQMDELHLDFPFSGSRMLRDLLAADGSKVGRRHVTTLMRKMGIEAAYRRPNTSKPAPGHKIFPYLLRGLTIDRPNQVWSTDITYIPMARGFVYLCAVMDWFARRILAWGLSNTMEAEFCVEVLEDALAKYGRPEIFNSDQGSQFSGTAFTGVLIKNEIVISMDGKGAYPAAAAGNPPFYAGKTVRVLVGYGPGGGYDIYARELGRFHGRHIPGNPIVVVQNMVGAGSLKAVNYLFNAAPRDGTTIATFARGIVFEPLIGHPDAAQFDAPKFNWIGSISNEVGVCAVMSSRGVNSWDDMRTKTTVIGASGAGADSDVFALVLRKLFGLPMRIVTGYPDGANMNLAMERGEIDGRCGWSWNTIVSRNRDWLVNKQIRVTVQIALSKHEDLPDVPLVMDLVSDARQAAALKLLVSRQSFARPFAAPPNLPAERVTTLREAFDATMRDPDFLAEMRRLDLEVRPIGGDEVQKLIGEIYASPPQVIELARDFLSASP